MRNHDQFFLKPFQIESNRANKFDIKCKLAVCKLGSWADPSGVCKLGSTCNDRYNIFNTKPIFNKSGQQRKQAFNAATQENTHQVWY